MHSRFSCGGYLSMIISSCRFIFITQLTGGEVTAFTRNADNTLQAVQVYPYFMRVYIILSPYEISQLNNMN